MTQGNVDISAIVPHPQTGRGRLCEGAIVVGMLRGKYLAPTYIWFLTRGAHLVQNGYTWYKMDTTVSSLVPKAPTLRNVNIEVVQAWRAWYFFSREQRLG